MRCERSAPWTAARLTVLLALTALAGCGGPKLAPVSGRVTCDGKPLANAALVLAPIPADANALEAPRAASAAVIDGRIENVTTFKKGDGAFVGRHRVQITLEFPESCPCLPVGEIIEKGSHIGRSIGGNRQSAYRQARLPTQLQIFPRGDDQAQPGRIFQQGQDQIGGGGQCLLHIVQ